MKHNYLLEHPEMLTQKNPRKSVIDFLLNYSKSTDFIHSAVINEIRLDKN